MKNFLGGSPRTPPKIFRGTFSRRNDFSANSLKKKKRCTQSAVNFKLGLKWCVKDSHITGRNSDLLIVFFEIPIFSAARAVLRH